MKLALVIDDYLPNSTRVGAKMFHELAVELVRVGHDVTVLTPEVGQKVKFAEDTIDGVRIWRFNSGPIKDTSKVIRAINETLLSVRAWQAISHKVANDSFDGVIYYSPSIFFGGLVSNIKKRCSCPSYLVLRDFFPQWVIDAGMIKRGSLLEKYFRYFESQSYQQADMIGVMSERNIAVFTETFQDKYPTQVLRNWASVTPYIRKDNSLSIREKLGLQDKVIYFYGGNIGHAQDMANLMRLAKGMAEHENAHFLFVGQGDEVELINDLAKQWQLNNFSYLPSVDQNTFKQILADVDIGLFSLSPKHTAHNFPGKLLGYMVESLPILGSVNIGNDLMLMVNESESGFVFINGDDNNFLSAAIELLNNEGLRTKLGNNSYELLNTEFNVSAIANNVLNELRARDEENRQGCYSKPLS